MNIKLQTFEEEQSENWKAKIFVIGGTLGVLLGLGSAYFLIRTTEEHQDGPPKIETTDALKIGFSLVSLVRGIAALGSDE